MVGITWFSASTGEFARCVELPLSDCLAPKCGQGPPCLHVPPAEVNRFGTRRCHCLWATPCIAVESNRFIQITIARHTHRDRQTTAPKPTCLAQTASNPQTFLVELQKVGRDTPADLFVTPSTFLFVALLKTRTRQSMLRRGRALAFACHVFLSCEQLAPQQPDLCEFLHAAQGARPHHSYQPSQLHFRPQPASHDRNLGCMARPAVLHCCSTCLRQGPWLKFLQI